MPDPVDAIEAGNGPRIVLVHSSVAGARQWTRLIAALEHRHRLIAPNLFGYGKTPGWSAGRSQRLEDQARLLEPLLCAKDKGATLIGHSFGGSVAMKAAQLYPGHVDRLILIEPNPFYLLRQNGRGAAYDQAIALRDVIKRAGRTGDWAAAAEVFADFWTGSGSWAAMPPDRRARFAAALRPNFHEWDAVIDETTPLAAWANTLPKATTVITADDTVRVIAEIAELMQAVCRHWRFARLPEGGHMAALSQPDDILPVIETALG